ncbi:ATP/GTP-binding protein [Streptomyces sp. H10-C2]|uniref:ATP/GTP-binding protein n=1 Tax=unclassified Streptomyces TaxID=2593676 RepID=UPI0024B8DAA8|nr:MULTISPECIES: ATP/GTP-binding protein [unclassified Streptomyces]MDJ0344237.1 ATP/GTP-binding protein [Streptomyces sp. PH10-H1]MDJ0373575.1 ATP/GTP-binding protein [Streptomyces sp. H10-C2]
MARNTTPKTPRPPRPGLRGWSGRGAGAVTYIDPAPEWRGTSVQVCGLWPYGAGSGTPMMGVPLGRDLMSGATVCADPISWFQRAKLIRNPSVFVLGQPGLGKSTIIRRMALGLSGYGTLPLVLGDLKPDYVDLVRAMGGQVISLGRGRGHLNVLDPGESLAAAARLTGDARRALEADIHGRRLNMVASLITILRNNPPTDREESILAAALKVLDDRHKGIPVLSDLVQVIKDAPEDVRVVALDRGDINRYRDITEGLESSLVSLLGEGRLGETFASHTTEPMRRDSPVCFDVSSIDDSELQLQAASLLACWSYGFGAITAAQALADAGLEPQRHYFVILDELWRVLAAGRGLVARVNALTRLNRQIGVGMAMITHTMNDLLALPTEEDRMMAKGFVERSGMVICGGLPPAEMPLLTQVVGMSQVEQDMVSGWSTPPSWDSAQGREAQPPGLGNFLIKVGGRPGIPLHVDLTRAERDVNDTNRKWAQR